MNVSETSNESTTNRNYLRAKRLILIPVFVFVISLLCLVIGLILAGRDMDSTAIYANLMLIAILSMFISPTVCFFLTVVGTVFAFKASKEGADKAKKFRVIGIIEIIACIIGVIISVLMFIGGMTDHKIKEDFKPQ